MSAQPSGSLHHGAGAVGPKTLEQSAITGLPSIGPVLDRIRGGDVQARAFVEWLEQRGAVCNRAQRTSDAPAHHRSMLNNLPHARLAQVWCLSVMTAGALSIVSGAALTIFNGELLIAAGVLPPLVMLIVWRQRTPVTIATSPLPEPSLVSSGV